jgi:uncharacterized protein (DUF433 family)
MTFSRITLDSKLMGGVPCIRGLRIPVATVVGMIADGLTEAEILEAYPDLERADISEALRYAAAAVRERELPLSECAGRIRYGRAVPQVYLSPLAGRGRPPKAVG